MAEPHPELDGALVGEIPALRRYLTRLAGGADEAEDLLQDVLERSLRYRDSFDPRGSLSGWLRRTAVRVWIDRRERRSREPARIEEPEQVAVEREPEARGLEGREELELWLARLAPTERRVLLRFHRDGESVADIAAELELPVGTVKSHLHRARRKVAQRVRGRGERDE